ncbi:histidine N-alpha-methyltransferase-like [Saccoglossus kowalevskii]|uniref:Histidine-specific methyltransferase bacterial-like 403 n=1 Tax=Saccoglossus kowalevskii TaxID=10224 RepID=A0A0U2T2M6_SACKO|nr:histidine-specific methyltransferase bacterial-like 403 [Saccoglossus kowalevskii]
MEPDRETVRKWLLSTPKYVDQWYLYDTYGSHLYEKVTTDNPHYDTYRKEMHILRQYADEIVSDLQDVILCELGAGNASKTTHLITALLKNNIPLTYMPIDVAKDFMEHHASLLMERFCGLVVKPITGLYIDGLNHLKNFRQNKLLIFLGGSFSNVPMPEMELLLTSIREALADSDRFLVGIDITQNKKRQLAAYSHQETIAPFILNVLTRLNREHGANFNLRKFRLCSKYVTSDSEDTFVENPQYIQIACQSTCEQVVHIDNLDLKIYMKKGEMIYAHDPEYMSLKWNWEQFQATMTKAGFAIEKKWSDDQNSFGVALLKKL